METFAVDKSRARYEHKESGHKSVFWNIKKYDWRVFVQIGTNYYSGGYFKKLEDAIKKADEMINELGLKHAQKKAVELGGKCLSEKYVNKMEKLIWECKDGHVWEASYCVATNYARKGKWCPYCSNRKIMPKVTIQSIREEFKNGTKTCLSEEYINHSQKLKWKCNICGHVWDTLLGNARKCGCPECSKKDLIERLKKNPIRNKDYQPL